MISAIWGKIKSAARWVYDWITVLTGLLVGLPTALIELLNFLGSVDISPLVGASTAVKIMAGVSLTKAILAFIESRVKARAA